MAAEKLTAQNAEFRLVCLAPDVCLTPVGNAIVPVPYPISHDLGSAQQCSKDVFVNDKPVFLHGLSYAPGVTGDEPGTKGGVVSGVNKKVSHSLTKSGTVFVNGHPVVRTGDQVHMNTQKP
jgi:hypothetical protein